jgi:subtilisin family serine protease
MNITFKFSIVALSVLMFFSLSHAVEGIPGIDFVENQIVFSVKPGIKLSTFDINENNTGSTGIEKIDLIVARENITGIERFYPYPLKTAAMRDVVGRMYVATVADYSAFESAMDALNADSNVEFAEPYYLNYIDYVPNDPMISSWYHLTNIEAYLAWDIIRGDSTDRSIIGIVDSGVYYDHPDLEDNMWINGPEDIDGDGRFTVADLNGLDDDGNGRVDDVVGYDIAMNDPDPAEPYAEHGTHVAGCATMVTDNNYGGAAVGWAARIMAVKASTDYNPGSMSHGYAGIIYATENGCHVVNCSWGRGGSPSQGEQNVINAAWQQGVAVVASAGNDNVSSPHYPSSYEHVLSVASTGVNDIKSSFSNYGSTVDICAPGEGIFSTWDRNSFASLQGTSMSSPIAAGVVALVRAANPSWGPDEAVNRVVNTADDIDRLNPNYAGMLGSGRVNAAAAVGIELMPRLDIDDFEITLTLDDGDGILNPSESFELTLTLINTWAGAVGVNGVLRSDNQFIVEDSVSTFGNIPGQGGTANNNSDPYSVHVNPDAIIGTHELTLHVTDTDGYQRDLYIPIEVSLEQLGFPGNIPGNIESPAIIFDFDSDNDNEIVVSAGDGNYYAFESDGSLSAGWPQSVGATAPGGAAIGDLDGNGDYEVVGISRSGDIYAWDEGGNVLTGFPYSISSITYCTPVLADIDGNGDLEIIATGFTGRKIYVLDHNGTAYGNWPYDGTNPFYGSAAAADIDNDDLPEIIACGFDSLLHVWNEDKTYVNGFPVSIASTSQTSAAIADIDGDGNLNIVITTFSGDVHVFNHDGTTLDGWPINVGSIIKSSPSLADLEPDGNLEILFGTNGGILYIKNRNGTNQGGYPVDIGSSISGSVVVGDIDGDGGNDVIFGAGDGAIHALGPNGQPLRNFPIMTPLGAPISAPAALGDLDSDGDAEIVVGVRTSGDNLEVIDYKDPLTNLDFPWPTFAADNHRSGFYGDFVTGIESDVGDFIPDEFRLMANYPNPFNMNTLIRFSIPYGGDAELDIFDLLGRRVKSFNLNNLNAGVHEIIWDGRNGDGETLASGIYFYKLEMGKLSQTKRMTLIK